MPYFDEHKTSPLLEYELLEGSKLPLLSLEYQEITPIFKMSTFRVQMYPEEIRRRLISISNI